MLKLCSNSVIACLRHLSNLFQFRKSAYRYFIFSCLVGSNLIFDHERRTSFVLWFKIFFAHLIQKEKIRIFENASRRASIRGKFWGKKDEARELLFPYRHNISNFWLILSQQRAVMIRMNPKYNAVNVFPPIADSYNNSSLPIGEGEIWPKFTKTLWHCLRYFFNPKQIRFIVSHYFFPKWGLDMGKIDYHVFGTSREQRIATFYFFKMRQAGNFQHENVFNDIFTCINALLVYTNFQNVSLVWILKWNVIYLLIRLWLRTISIWAIVLPKPILIGFLSLIRFEISNETSACSPGKYIVFKDFKLPLASFVTLLRGPKLLFSHKIAKPELDNHNQNHI